MDLNHSTEAQIISGDGPDVTSNQHWMPGAVYADLRRFLSLVVMLLVGAWLLRALASTLLLFAVVFLAAMVLNPPVTALERRGFKRTPIAAVTVLLLAGSLLAVTWLATPPFLAEMNSQAAQAPVYEQRIRRQSERW